jgi:uncharacterized protein YdhG (YjbR/CyaY superfamily)
MPDACDALKAYLKIRGDKPGALLVGREGVLNNKAITQIVSGIIENVPELRGIEGFKPTNLRDAFEDALRAAGIYPKTKEAMMGHNSNIEMEYGGYKQMMESFVDAAKKVYAFLRLKDAAQNEYDSKVKSALEHLTSKVAEKDQIIESLVQNGSRKENQIKELADAFLEMRKTVDELKKAINEKEREILARTQLATSLFSLFRLGFSTQKSN